MPKAYPFYDAGYTLKVDLMRRWLEAHTPNLHPVGRNGMFRYNNQDHSMFTAQLTVQNMLDGTRHDVWEVNVEDDYHEEVSPHLPTPARTGPGLIRRRRAAPRPAGRPATRGPG